MMAISLDIGKVVAVSFIYKFWSEINALMKTYMAAAVIVLMIITSAGVFGFLSAEFQKAISNTSEQQVLISALSEEKDRLSRRKQEIDAQIAKLPDNIVRGRQALMKQFEPEVSQINSRLVEIDRELPKLRVETIKKNVEVGPIIYIAEAFDTTPEKAVKWIILVIILVFDPLAIALLIAGNFLLKRVATAPPTKAEKTSDDVNGNDQAEQPSSTPIAVERVVELNDVTPVSVEKSTVEPSTLLPEIQHDEIKADSTPPEVDRVTDETPHQVGAPNSLQKSSLEEVNATRIDVQFGDDGIKNFRNLNSIYSDK